MIDLRDDTKESMYPFKNVPGLFVGLEHKVKPPFAKWQHWKHKVEGKLWLDVQAFQQRYTRKKNGRIEFPVVGVECRMSGYVSADRKSVTFSPRIWFLYDQKRWEKKVLKFVEELEWLAGEGFGRPEVHRGSPRPASLRLSMKNLLCISPGAGYHIADRLELFVHCESPSSPLGCGLLFCATLMNNGNIESQHISRIGGLLSLDSTRLAMTTAHGILQDIFQRTTGLTELSESPSERVSSEISTASTDIDVASSDSDTDETNSEGEEGAIANKVVGTIDSGIIKDIDWYQLPASWIRETSFLGVNGSTIEECIRIELRQQTSAHGTDSHLSRPSNSATGDFSFIKIPQLDRLHNWYRYDVAESPKHFWEETEVTRLAEPEELTGGPVHLVLRP